MVAMDVALLVMGWDSLWSGAVSTTPTSSSLRNRMHGPIFSQSKTSSTPSKFWSRNEKGD